MLYQQVNITSISYELPPFTLTSEEIEEQLKPVYQRLKLARLLRLNPNNPKFSFLLQGCSLWISRISFYLIYKNNAIYN